MEIFEDGEYGLDGSFVSNEKYTTDITKSLILVLEIILAVLVYLVVLFLFIATPALLYNIYLFLDDDKDIDLASLLKKAYLIIGSMICIALFGIASLVAELPLLHTHISFIVFVKQGLFFLLLLLLAIAFIIELVVVTFFGANVHLREHFGAILIFFSFCIVILLDFFTIAWAVASMYSSILLAFAYPLHMIALLVIHIGFVFVISVISAVVVSQVHNYYTQNSERSLCRAVVIFIVVLLPMLLFASAVYYITIVGYTTTIVNHVVLTDDPLKFILIVPSVLLFFGRWLIRRKFFGKQ